MCKMHPLPLWLRLWQLASSCELRGKQRGRTMIPKCLRACSGKPVFKRQARRSNPCHCACHRADSLIFGPCEFNGKRRWPFASGHPNAIRRAAMPCVLREHPLSFVLFSGISSCSFIFADADCQCSH